MTSQTSKAFLSLLLLLSLFATGFVPHAAAQQVGQSAASDTLSTALAAIEAKVEARRQELGIPGMSLAIVKDGKVVYAKGLGYKDFENKVPVTADTQFAIGSSTKAFTALSVLMSHDERKLSLDASPKTVLPYFKMADPDTDKNMTIRDLLTHSSGLNRTDIAMVTGKLNRAELIRVAGEAKPIGKLRERFGYQNLMYAAAGETVAVAQKQPWEKFVPERIFKPLGMANSNMTIAEMEKAKDHSFGYVYNFDTKETKKLPYRSIGEVAPAGSINSSANDMAKWVQFVLGGGTTADGKRLISEASYAEWLKPQMKVNPGGTVNYALGWFVQKWNDHTVVQHGGNIDGFNALVAIIPEKKVGFVMLTNVTGSSLGNDLMPIVWENILGKPGAKDTAVVTGDVPPENEAGKYRFEAAGFDLDVQWKEGKLTAEVPGQPVYTLEKVSGRRYKLAGAPDGFFVTFKDKELFLEQPQGNYTLPRAGAPANTPTAAQKELIGKFVSEANGRGVEVKEQDGKVMLLIEGQPPYALAEKDKDKFSLSPLPDSYFLTVKRTPDGKLEKFSVMQPEGEFFFKPAGESKIAMTVDELMAKAIAASGGEANWKKLNSRMMVTDVDFEQQGVKATATSWAKAPNLSGTEMVFSALGKKIALGWEYFDGTSAETAYTFSPTDKATGKRLEDTRIGSDFYSMLDWRSKYKSITIERMADCGEAEKCYAVVFEPEKGSKFTEFYSANTFLLKQRTGVVTSSTSTMEIPYTIKFEDYREVDGVKMPFKMTNNNPGNGNIVTTVRSIKHNVPVEDSIFKPRTLKL